MSKTSETTLCHVSEIREVKKNLNLPQQSYSPRSPCIINYGLRSLNEMCDHSIYILYSRSSKDVESSVRPVVNLLHAPKLVLREINSTNSAKIVRKCLGTERFSQISRIPRAKRESPLRWIPLSRKFYVDYARAFEWLYVRK